MYSSVFHQRCEYKGWLIHTFVCDTSINLRILDGAHLERHSKVLVFINALLLAEEVVAFSSVVFYVSHCYIPTGSISISNYVHRLCPKE